MSKKRNKIRVAKENKKTFIKKTLVDKPSFEICLIYHWYKTVSINGFTNLLRKSDDLCDELTYIMGEFFPIIYKEHDCIFNNRGYRHCHKVNLHSKNIQLYEKIIKEIGKDIEFNSVKDMLWQVGLTGSIRIIGVLSENTFYPLFIDRHHLLHPSEKHNQKDLKKYQCCIK